MLVLPWFINWLTTYDILMVLSMPLMLIPQIVVGYNQKDQCRREYIMFGEMLFFSISALFSAYVMKSVKVLKDKNLKTDDIGLTTKTRDMRAADQFGKSYFQIWMCKLIVTVLFVGYAFSVAYNVNYMNNND